MSESLVKYEERYSVSQVIDQVKTIQQIMDAVMKQDVHYGIIPGTEKPSLYKPGAEKLSLTFRIAPKYFGEDDPKDLGKGHREYIIRCELYHITSGAFLGAGVGSCSTMESKYRYRDAYEVTGKPVPKGYWDKRDASLIGGSGFRAKKIDGQWQIVKIAERQENPDIADTYNTVLKMAKKRAHIDAVLTATAASDIFTQDLEDLVEDANGDSKPADSESTSPPKRGRPKADEAWRKDFKDALIRLCGTEKDAVAFLGTLGYSDWQEVENHERAREIYKEKAKEKS